MPSDKLENLFKQKVAEGQHTPPPFEWDKESSWQKLQPTLLPNRRKRLVRFYYGVAASAILLLSMAITLLLQKNQPAEKFATTSRKVNKSNLVLTPPESKNLIILKPKPDTNLKAKNPATDNQTISVKKGNIQKNSKISERQVVAPEIESESNKADEILTELPEIKLADNKGTKQVTATAPVTKQIKITIVLGARSVAKIDSAEKGTRAIAKNKLRLKMNLPGAEGAEISQMATNNSYHKPLTWETKIKF